MAKRKEPLSPEELEDLIKSYEFGPRRQRGKADGQKSEGADGGGAAGSDGPDGAAAGVDRDTDDGAVDEAIAAGEAEGVDKDAQGVCSDGAASKEGGEEGGETAQEVSSHRQAPPGTLEFKDGKVTLHPPEKSQKPPAIEPGRYVIVKVNDVVIEDRTPVGPDDRVEILPDDREPSLDFDIEITSDSLEAYLDLKRNAGQVVELVDLPPQALLRPRGRVTDRPTPRNPTPEEIVERLSEHGVEYGIDLDVVRAIASGELKGRQKVAAGIPPKPGTDGRIEYLFEEGDRRPKFDSKTGRVDYMETDEIPRVEPGDIIAVRHPPKEGAPGRSVTNKELPAPKPKDVKPQARDGAELSPDGSKVVAKREGRPSRKGDQFFVMPVMVIEGNVGLETGNVRFRGDVVISGDVEERALVQATGRIEVKGNVVRARLISQGDITVAGQVVGGKIIAGTDAVYRRLLEGIEEIASQVEALCYAVRQLHESFQVRASYVPPADQLVVFLLGKKFKELPTAVESLTDFVKKIEFPIEVDVLPVLKGVERYVHPVRRVRIRKLDDLQNLLHELRVCQAALRDVEAEPAHVVGNAAHQAEIRASGDIFIQGQGAYHSTIAARGTAVISGSMRGGTLESGREAYIGELGSPVGAKTLVRVAMTGAVYVRRVYPGVKVRIQSSVWECLSVFDMGEIRLASSGAIEVRGIDSWQPPEPKTS